MCSASFFKDTATTTIYTLSLHDALPISAFGRLPPPAASEVARIAHLVLMQLLPAVAVADLPAFGAALTEVQRIDRKSTRLNSSHRCISYAVFCLKKKKKKNTI